MKATSFSLTHTPATETLSTHSITEGPFLVATDGSDASRPAMEAALQLRGRHGTPVRVVGVVPELPTIAWDYGVLHAPIDDFAARRDGLLLRVKAQLEDVGGVDAEWPIEMRVGDPAVEIARCAEEVRARLVILGVEHRRVTDRLLAREVAVRVMQSLGAPMLVVPADFPISPTRMTLATDFSPESVHAAVQALELYPTIASVDVAHVEPLDPTAMSIIDWMTPDEEAIEQGFREIKAALLDVRPLRITPVLLRGTPITQIAKLAQSTHTHLLVTSAAGKGALERLLVGSTSRGVLRHSPCALMVIPTPVTGESP